MNLLPCPFCGAYAHVLGYHGSPDAHITCVDCRVTTAMCPNRESASRLWNKRVKIDAMTIPRDPFREKFDKEERERNEKPPEKTFVFNYKPRA